MNDNDPSRHEARVSRFPIIRTVPPSAILKWLRAAWRDLRQAGLASLFYGACFAVGGWLLKFVFSHAFALFAGLTSGFLLVGPFLTFGLYDLSRSVEQNQPCRLLLSLAAWRSNLANVGLFAALLAVVLLVWARVSMVVFALFFSGGLPTFVDMVRTVLTFEQPDFALVYFVVGGFFATFVFAVSVVSLPMMLDRKTDAITAALVSLVTCARNPGTLLLWAACIAVLAAIGLLTLFIGLFITIPLIGHASWHAYRDLVEPDVPDE